MDREHVIIEQIIQIFYYTLSSLLTPLKPYLYYNFKKENFKDCWGPISDWNNDLHRIEWFPNFFKLRTILIEILYRGLQNYDMDH